MEQAVGAESGGSFQGDLHLDIFGCLLPVIDTAAFHLAQAVNSRLKIEAREFGHPLQCDF